MTIFSTFPSFPNPISLRLNGLALILLSLFLMAFSGSSTQRISMSMETKILKQGKVLTIQAEVFYEWQTGTMVTHFSRPMEYFFLANSKGEAKVYYPASNEVMIKQGMDFDTEKTMLYFFLSNKLADLGLKEMGFTITSTRFREKMMITEWKPPSTLVNQYSKVELVHEDYLPIYIAYFNPKGQLNKKIFYYNYERIDHLALPMKVLECVYVSKTDSILNRIAYSDVKTGTAANSPFFNFKIPANAKLVR